ncbi:hypothetical protein LAZ67_2000333, partial [Cordylochernes scorpioides]
MVWAESPSKAEQKPARHGEKAQQCAELSKKEDLQKKSSNLFGKSQGYANPPAGGHHANPATPTDFVTASFSEAAAQANRSWADLAEDQGPGEDDNFTVVKSKKRRRDSPGSPTAATSSGTRGAGATRRPRSSTGWAPRAEEVRTTQAHIAEARARQASSTEDHCVYVERSPELEPYHYIRAIDRMFGSTREVFQVTKMNGHFLVGLANKSMAERLVNEGLEVEGTLHRAFPFRKRAERITVGNLPFFVGDAAVISALSSFGRVTSIAPKLMKAGPYVYNDGRREAFIILREGMTIERLPTRLDISIKGEAWPAYLSSGIRCSRCRGQGHRRANCPMLAGRTTAPGPAAPTSPTSIPPATAPRLPQQPSARPPPPASPSSTMEVSDVPPASRAAPLPPAALQPSPPAPSALPLEDTPPAPPPVTPAPSLRTPGSREPAAPTPDVEMSIVEETFASSTSSAKNATRVDLDAFIEELPSVSFAKTDALGLGREEVLDLLSSRTKAQRKGPLLSPPQCDALVGLIGQILDLKPGHTSNLDKVLGQVRAELTKTPAAAPTPPLPAPRPDGPIPPPPHGDTTTPDMATSPSPLSTQMDRALMDKRWEALRDLMNQLDREFELDLEHRFQSRVDVDDIIRAILYPGDREPLIKRLPTRDRYTLGGLTSTAIRRARELDPSILECMSALRKLLLLESRRPSYQAMVGRGSLYCKYTTCLHSAVRPRVARAPEFFASGGRKVSRMATNMVWAESPSKAEEKPVRLGSKAQPSAEITAKNVLQTNSSMNSKENHNYVNPPAGSQDEILPRRSTSLAAIPTSNAAAQVRRNWADITEEVNPGAEEGFTLVQGRKRRRGSANSPTAAAPSSNAGGSRTIRRPQPSAGSVPRAQEIRVTRAHIAEARARQASSSEEHCVYIEHSPELEPFHYLRALDRMLGGTAGVIQITKVNGHQLLGLTNRGLAERLISEGLEVEGTLLRAFPFRKRAERITVGNLPFFIGDSAVINALSPYGRVTSIAPKQMKAGPYVYVDGRRDVFITLHEGITIERIPTRLDINIKGEAWPAYLSSGIRCPRCHGQGHRRAICPLLAGLANNTRMAPPTTPAGVPPPTTPAPPQRSAAQPPAPTPSNPAMEICSAPPVARAALHSSAPRPSPPAAPAFPMEETPPAPPPVTPAPTLQTPGSREPAAPTPDVEMSIVETFASSTSSAKNATRVDLDAFIEGHPSGPAFICAFITRGAGATRRPRSCTGWAPRAEEVRTTQAHIAEARARQASSTEDHCVYVERSPELEPYHYIRAIDRMFGSTREVFQVTKMNGHFLVGLANKSMAERLVNEGLEVEGTLHRAFPFRKRAERITVGNLPFFVGDAAVISALSSFGRVTSIAPKLMKAGPYVYNDGRREAFIILREGMTIERLPTRLDISIKGEAWPAYLSSGIRCSRCRGQGHRRANCPMLAGRTTAPGPATPTSPTSVPPATAPRLPQQPSARPPPPASPSSTMEVSDVPPASRAAPLPPAALQPSPPAPSALPLEDTPPAPPPVTPAPSLRTPGSREPAAPIPDVEMSIVEETFASSTSSAKNATRVDLDAFIEELPSVSFAKTDALGLGREEVLDLLSSRTKAQRKGPLLSPPQCDALVSLIGQILDLKPGHTSNLYKVLGQVRAELTKTPAATPTPPLPAPRPDGPIPPPPHGDTTTPDMATSPSPLSTQMDRALMDKRWEALRDLMNQLDREFELDLEHRFHSRVDVDDIIRAILYPGDREPLIKRLPTRDRYTLGGLMSTAIRRARELDPSILE